MNTTLVRCAATLALLAVAPAGVQAASAPGAPQTPAIAGEGPMHPLPQAAYQPSKDAVYKVVFAVARGSEQPGEPNPGLEAVARAVNLYASAGVPLDHLKFVAVLYGPATGAALDAAHYHEHFKADDPNLKLIHELRKAGVDVAVCGQAMLGNHFALEWANPEVTVALSALTTITMLQTQGYVLMPV